MKTESGSISQAVYERLRQDIVFGTLRPNQRIVEAEIADQLNASRTPVRESLHRLSEEGLVHRDRSGWIVHEHTLEDIRQIYEVRLALEGYAARLAAERGTKEDIARIQDLFPKAGKEREILTGELNLQFHEAVVSAAHNERLHDLVRRTREYAFNERLGRLYTSEELKASGEDHTQLLNALLRHDGDRAETIARRHVVNALKIIARLF